MIDIVEFIANLERPDWTQDTPVEDIWLSAKYRALTAMLILEQIDRGFYDRSNAEGDLEDMETNPDGFRQALENALSDPDWEGVG